jgi:hypothetical protein
MSAIPLVIPSAELLTRTVDPLGRRGYRETRADYQQLFSFAIPGERALAALAALGPSVEVNAGGGYWAGLLRDRGADVLAFDLEPCPVCSTWTKRQWTRVDRAHSTIAGAFPQRTLLTIWPGPGNTAASDALAAYHGDTVAYIGEGSHHHDADPRFFDLLDRGWALRETVAIPNWERMVDRLHIYVR